MKRIISCFLPPCLFHVDFLHCAVALADDVHTFLCGVRLPAVKGVDLLLLCAGRHAANACGSALLARDGKGCIGKVMLHL